MRLKRPYIPWSVREEVVHRQAAVNSVAFTLVALNHRSVVKRVKLKLEELFAGQSVELHHRPSLCNRFYDTRGKVPCYSPDANDPAYLVYLPADEHDIETRVRGRHGQYSDLALARKRKRIARKQNRKWRHKWPKRKFLKNA